MTKLFHQLCLWIALCALAFASSGCGDSGSSRCSPGEANCSCRAQGAACVDDALSCIQGVCRVCENGSCIPAEPQCYSPCRGSFVDSEGNQRVCSEEGLVEGCLTGQSCKNGSCVPDAPVAAEGSAGAAAEEAAPPRSVGACAADPECPEHQVCIAKHCYSTCDSDAECSDGSVCRKKVCRQLCDAQTPCRGLAYSCQRLGNTKSVCLPQVAQDTELEPREPATQSGSFRLEAGGECEREAGCPLKPLRFNTNLTSGSFKIVNLSPVARRFHVQKVVQTQPGPDGNDQTFRESRGENPLPWLELGEKGAASRQQSFDVELPAGETIELELSAARSAKLPRWEGALEVSSPGLGPQPVQLSYSERVPGRWSGKIYYFGNFGDHTQGQDQLGAWMRSRDDLSLAQKVPNAFVRAWANFRAGRITGSELDAVIESVVTGSWEYARVKELCAQAKGGVCAPFVGPANRPVISITNDPKTAPVPSGVVELGLSLNLGEGSLDPACDGDPFCFAGRIDSREAMQYPNNPGVVLRFAADPSECSSEGKCLAPLSELSSRITLGARFHDATGAGCNSAVDFGLKELPWLVPGMRRDGEQKAVETVYQCRDSALPFSGDATANVELAAANPVPDGLQRQRTLELVDGLMVEQQTLMVIFKESLESFLDGDSAAFASYGFMMLKREAALPDASELAGNLPAEPSGTRTRQALETECPKYLLDRTFPTAGYAALSDVPESARPALVSALLLGRTSDPRVASEIDPAIEEPHYLCSWTELDGQIVAGQTGTVSASSNTVGRTQIDGPCPAYARVVFFTLAKSANIGVPTTCAASNDCDRRLKEWTEQPGVVRLPPSELPSFPGSRAAFDLTWSCKDSTQVLCDNYQNLLEGKKLMAPLVGETVLNPLRTDIKEAFRYKFQFQNRDGQSVGFAPAVCDQSSRLVPYCYSPPAILDVKDRVDCALALYDDHVAGSAELPGGTAEILRDYLRENFGFTQIPNPLGDPRVEDGFERLYSELLVMLGDDAYTAAFASRFDLAESRVLGFEGSRFEAGGIDLSGVAGREMYKLYQASQYYELVLDRFFSQSAWLWHNLEDPDQQLNGFLSNKTVTGYLTRVIRASTQLSNTASEIARRYQAFNRPDLARRVIERGYARSYLESQILSQFMRSVEQVVPGDQQDQVAVSVSDAERRYRVAMLDMKSAYKRITDDRTVFGFAPDYIPFPALEESEDGAFPVIVARAKERLDVADTDEQHALSSNRSFETDAAAFQGELVKIRADFDKQLGDLCGTFQGLDGKVYPAVARYKHLSDEFQTLSDPCGLERGEIWGKGQDIGTMDLELRQANQEAEGLRQQAVALIERVRSQCGITKETSETSSAIQKRINSAENSIDIAEAATRAIDRTLNSLGQALTLMGEESAGIAPYSIASAAAIGTNTYLDAVSVENKDKIRNLEAEQTQLAAYADCQQFAAVGIYELRDIERAVLLKNIDILLAAGNLGVAGSELSQLNNERVRLESQWEDNNQLTINVQAAKNDPNVRIYKNDAIINADRSFTSAVREVYRATKVYEYYTGQSYAALDKLFLVRMVSAGDQNLKQYLAELEDAFFAFEEQFGKPATRVAVISLRDQVFGAPLFDRQPGARQLALDERVKRFREKLMADELVDDEGNIVVPFQTSFDELSPLTNDHKILFIEAAIESQQHGDDVARLYLRQLGTSAIVNAAGERRTYLFPPRTAVLNPLFPSDGSSGREAFDDLLGGPNASIFRDYRFRDRPFVNSSWQLVFNPRTEAANKDIQLSAIDDIKLYVYYTDFSNF